MLYFNAKALAKDAIQDIFSKKVPQAIWNVQVQAGTTNARISWSQTLDGPGFVWLYDENGIQIGGAGAVAFAPSHFAVTFTDLPQNADLQFRIDILDPRPPAEQIPGGIVSYVGQVETGSRTAQVTLKRLKELQGEGEITFVTKIYDWDGTYGYAIHQPDAEGQLQYGRAHMDPNGNPIGDPFGPPRDLFPAPDALLIFTYAVVDESSFWPWGGTGLVGMGLPDTLSITQIPNHVHGDGYSSMEAWAVVPLPQAEGPFNDIPFELFSGPWDYAFQLNGTVSGNVSKYINFKDLSLHLSPRNIRIAVATAASPRAVVAAGNSTLDLQLTAGGQICRLLASERKPRRLEVIGDLDARWFAAGRRDDGTADLVALRRDGALFYGRAAKEGATEWRDAGQRLAFEPEVLRSSDGELHVFGVNGAGTVVHGQVGTNQWERWDEGFAGRVSCAVDDRGEGWLFATRNGRLVQARVSLNGSVGRPAWEEITAPFDGPVVAATVEDGPVVALGVDKGHVYWVRWWHDGRWEPEGWKWERAGTFTDLFRGAEQSVPTSAQD